ncbi:SNAP25 homologous protein SNAP33-like protein [Tanacetum coccineum]
MLQEYLYSEEHASFMYPSGIDRFKKKFTDLEEQEGKGKKCPPPNSLPTYCKRSASSMGNVEILNTWATNTKEKENLAETKEKSSALDAANSFKEEALLQRDVDVESKFVLKFSALEIYNEIVKDTVVEKLTEEVVNDAQHLRRLISTCVAKQASTTPAPVPDLLDGGDDNDRLLGLTLNNDKGSWLSCSNLQVDRVYIGSPHMVGVFDQEKRRTFLIRKEGQPDVVWSSLEYEEAKQDAGLSELSNILEELKEMAVDMGSKIERQSKALNALPDDVEESNF